MDNVKVAKVMTKHQQAQHDLQTTRYLFLTHNSEPCEAGHAAQTLSHQHHNSLVFQHRKRANKMVDMKLSLDIRITRNQAQLDILQQS